jgi:hypothetical protein
LAEGISKSLGYLAMPRDSFEDDRAFSSVLHCGDRVPIAFRMEHPARRSRFATSWTMAAPSVTIQSDATTTPGTFTSQ